MTTISPVVHGGRTSRYWFVWSLHALGATIAAAATGFLLGLSGSVLGAPWGALSIALVVVIGVLYALRDLLGLPIPLPDLQKQVPEWWRTFFSPAVTSTLYGVGLGSAFYTSLRYGTYVVVSALVVAAGDPLLGALVCAPFGIGRALVIAAADLDSCESPSAMRLFARSNGVASCLIAFYLALTVAY
ncbi:MAG TPA: hypothetical protein VE174_14025 [Actinomycetota bacterium]|nr:hypothetical protein [Actinomycetota bacterium]